MLGFSFCSRDVWRVLFATEIGSHRVEARVDCGGAIWLIICIVCIRRYTYETTGTQQVLYMVLYCLTSLGTHGNLGEMQQKIRHWQSTGHTICFLVKSPSRCHF
ncbi:hypothetical protein BD311DRAFT_767176 [Dichomitus squalens]|uniref:Uncharacterized protein n=1 Tax=Dichomitus squalens TaxID=114155 RepID=A0A4Q9MED7_9APHY|nr:hypothetical protein BD311DRAFT_767176 [Dichomitus squalens]